MSPDRMLVQEVAPRDGLQIEPRFLTAADKIALIDGLSAAGFTRIEADSFVSKAVPMLADSAEVCAGIAARLPLRGADRALTGPACPAGS